MRIVFDLIARILANCAGILLASYLIEEVTFDSGFVDLIIVGSILALANIIIKPILKFVSGPLIVLTMGLFMIIINIVILWLVAGFMPILNIASFWGYFWSVIILAILNAITHIVIKKKKA